MDELIFMEFKNYLMEQEKTINTISKYLSNIREFYNWKKEKDINKQLCSDYKKFLLDKNLNPVTINTKLSSLNCLLKFLHLNDYCLKFLKIQKKVFCEEEKELTKKDYENLVNTAYKLNKEQLALIIQTICSTGIRVSELIKYHISESYKIQTKPHFINITAIFHFSLLFSILFSVFAENLFSL